MTQPLIITPLLFLLIFSCTTPNQPASVGKDFHLPVIVQAPAEGTIEYLKADSLNEIHFRISGKSKFADTILLDREGFLSDSTSRIDMISEHSSPEIRDSLATDGFQIFPDYNTSIHYKEEKVQNTFSYFPVYVVNETSSAKVFFGNNGHVLGIQEAIDTTSGWEEWRPIEAERFEICENGSFGVKVHPGEFIMFLVPKYQGEEKNAMRIRLQIGESVYISRSYDGSFSARQFNLSQASRIYWYLKNEKHSGTPYSGFYGALPRGFYPE